MYELCLLLNVDLLVFMFMYKYKIKFINIMFFDIIILLFVLKNTFILFIFLTLIIQIQLIPINLFKAFVWYYYYFLSHGVGIDVIEKIILSPFYWMFILIYTLLILISWFLFTTILLFASPLISIIVMFFSFELKNYYYVLYCAKIFFIEYAKIQYNFDLNECQQKCELSKKILKTFNWVNIFEIYFKDTEQFKFLFNNTSNTESATPEIPPAPIEIIPDVIIDMDSQNIKIECEIKKNIYISIRKKLITIEDVENLEPSVFIGIIFLILINLEEKEIKFYPKYITEKYKGNIKMTNKEKECAKKFIFNKETKITDEQLKENISKIIGFSIEISKEANFIMAFSVVNLQKEEFLKHFSQ